MPETDAHEERERETSGFWHQSDRQTVSSLPLPSSPSSSSSFLSPLLLLLPFSHPDPRSPLSSITAVDAAAAVARQINTLSNTAFPPHESVSTILLAFCPLFSAPVADSHSHAQASLAAAIASRPRSHRPPSRRPLFSRRSLQSLAPPSGRRLSHRLDSCVQESRLDQRRGPRCRLASKLSLQT